MERAQQQAAEQVRPLSCAELRRIDAEAASVYGLPAIVLLENAGRNAAECILASIVAEEGNRGRPTRVLVLTGSGNNGGDGCVVARYLSNAGADVELTAMDALEDLREDHRMVRRAVERMRIAVHLVRNDGDLDGVAHACARADVLVDALLGTGFRGEMRPLVARVIETINGVRASAEREARIVRVVSLDLPSGMDGDTGRVARSTVIADRTLTFVARKLGFDSAEARAYLGEIEVVSIGVPRDLVDRVARGE